MLQLTINYVLAQYKHLGVFPLVLVPTRSARSASRQIEIDVWQLLVHEPAIYDPTTDKVLRLLNANTGWSDCEDVLFIQTVEHWNDIRERVVLVKRHVAGDVVDVDDHALIDQDSVLSMAFIEDRVSISTIEVSLASNVRKTIQEAWKKNAQQAT
jgi:hypothetical protein